jgi:hypothetical protein
MKRTEHPGSATGAAHVFALEGGLSTPLVVGLGAALIVEGAVLHLWIASKSEPWAWTITAINAATLLWLWREHAASARSAFSIDDRGVMIAIGNRFRCQFPHGLIADARATTWRSVPDIAPRDYVNVAKPLEPNITLVLRQPADMRMSLGLRKRVARIDLRVSDAPHVLATLRSAIASVQTRS